MLNSTAFVRHAISGLAKYPRDQLSGSFLTTGAVEEHHRRILDDCPVDSELEHLRK